MPRFKLERHTLQTYFADDIYSAYVSKHRSNHEKKQVITLMNRNGESWHYLAVKKLSALLLLLLLIISKHKGDFYCLNYLGLVCFRRKSKLELHQKVYENKDFCNIVMPTEDTKELISTKNLIKHHLFFMKILNI